MPDWLSRFKQSASSNENEAGLVVYMSAVEFSQLRAILAVNEPKVVLEWGSGGSTQALLETVPSIERMFSVEHNRQWYEKVRSTIVDERLSLYLCEPGEPEPHLPRGHQDRVATLQAYALRAEQDPSLFSRYVTLPRSFGVEFDFVLVDGRARVFCLREGFALLRPGGVLVIHDAQRSEYHATLGELGSPVFLEPWEQGQVCLLKKPARA